MGSFDVSCAISGLQIECGDPVVFLPLIKYKYGNFDSALFVSNDGASGMFYPAMLPFSGSYGDYGYVEDVEKTKNTEILESYFGISCEDLVNVLSGGRKVYDYYNDLTIQYIKHEGWLSSYDKNFDPDFMQFLIDRNPTQKSKLESYMLIESEHEYASGNYSITTKDSFIEKDNFCRKFLNDHSYYLLVDKEKQPLVKTLDNMTGCYIHGDIYNGLIQGFELSEFEYNYFNKHIADNLSQIKNADVFLKENIDIEMQRLSQSIYNRQIKTILVAPSLAEFDCVSQIYISKLDDVYTNIVDINKLLWQIGMLNKVLLPSIYAGQENHHESTQTLIDIMQKVVNEQRSKYEEY